MPLQEAASERADVAAMLAGLPFFQGFGVEIVGVRPGNVTLKLPSRESFAGPPGQFPAAMVGMIGDMAAVTSCLSLLPAGWAVATLDFTIKMTGPSTGAALLARGKVLQNGKTISVGASDVFAQSEAGEILCGTVLATTRNFIVKR